MQSPVVNTANKKLSSAFSNQKVVVVWVSEELEARRNKCQVGRRDVLAL
jgi:hypothetical protein